MKNILLFAIIQLVLVLASNSLLVTGPMLPPIIDETATYNHTYKESLNSTIEYIFVYKSNVSIFFF